MSVGKHAVGRRPLGKLALLLALAMVVTTFAVGPLAGAGEKVKEDVCHVEGNGDYHLINISENAVQQHLDHGDFLPGTEVPGTLGYYGDDCTVPSYVRTVNGATAATPWGEVDIIFDVYSTAPHGWMTWTRGAPNVNLWSGDVISATIGTTTASFIVRVDNGAPAVIGCDITIAVTEGFAGVGTWDITAVDDITAGSCDAAGQIQGPYTISAGEIVIVQP